MEHLNEKRFNLTLKNKEETEITREKTCLRVNEAKNSEKDWTMINKLLY